MRELHKALCRIALMLSLSAAAGGCAWMFGLEEAQTPQAEVTQSLLQYLYPHQEKTEQTMPVADVTHLRLPLRVGVAFLPSSQQQGLPPGLKETLLSDLSAAFRTQKFISQIVELPEGTLHNSGGFGELDRVAFMHRVDVIALIGYDQVAYLDNSPVSLLDLTIVGAYVVPSHINEVHTSVNTAVIHVPSRRYLIGASGQHDSDAATTLAHASRQIRQRRSEGLIKASHEMSGNLEVELVRFKQQVQQDDSIRTSGAGSMSLLGVLLLAGFFGFAARRRHAVG